MARGPIQRINVYFEYHFEYLRRWHDTQKILDANSSCCHLFQRSIDRADCAAISATAAESF
jgi:hypothetical protein